MTIRKELRELPSYCGPDEFCFLSNFYTVMVTSAGLTMAINQPLYIKPLTISAFLTFGVCVDSLYYAIGYTAKYNSHSAPVAMEAIMDFGCYAAPEYFGWCLSTQDSPLAL
jgi:hypothetical protein